MIMCDLNGTIERIGCKQNEIMTQSLTHTCNGHASHCVLQISGIQHVPRHEGGTQPCAFNWSDKQVLSFINRQMK